MRTIIEQMMKHNPADRIDAQLLKEKSEEMVNFFKKCVKIDSNFFDLVVLIMDDIYAKLNLIDY